MAKPLKFYQTLNQQPKGPRHGKHRRASPTTYDYSAGEPSDGAGGSDQSGATWTTVNFSSYTTITWDLARTDPEPPAIPYAGIRTGELIGHRLWWLIEGQICSLAHRRLWLPAETISGHTKKPAMEDWYNYQSVIWGGVYAFFSADQLEKEINEYQAEIAKWGAHRGRYLWLGSGWEPYTESSTLVAGTIKMWGEVIEHERGYRAEFAKLNSLDAIYGPGDLDALRARYGVTALTP